MEIESRLALANAHNRLAISRAFSTTAQTRELSNKNCIAILSGVPFPLCNGIFLPRFDGSTVGQEVREVLAQFRSAQLPGFFWIDRYSEPTELRKELVLQGCRSQGAVKDIAVDLEEFVVPELKEVQIKKISQGKELEAWIDIIVESFSFPDFVGRYLIAAITYSGREGVSPFANYLVTMDGQNVGTATLFFSHGVAGVYNIAIAKEFRNQDLGKAMLGKVIREIKSAKIRYAVGSAFDQVLPFYQKAPLISLGETELFLI